MAAKKETKKVLKSVAKDKKITGKHEVTDLLKKNILSVDFTLSPIKVLEQLEKRVASFIKKQISIRENIVEKIAFINSFKLHNSIQVHCSLVPMTPDNQPDYKTLHAQMNQKNRLAVKTEDLNMVLLKINSEGKEYNALTLLGHSMDKIKKNGGTFNSKSQGSRTYVYDYIHILRKILTAQLLIHFEQSQPNLIQEMIVEYFLDSEKKLTVYPQEEKFQQDFLEVAKKLGADTTNANPFESSALMKEEHLRKSFYREAYLRDGDLVYTRYNQVFQWLAKDFAKMLNSKKHFELNRAEFRQYAKVWNMKLNIPKSHLKAMKNNAFLSNFGEVELDQEVDLIKFKEFENDFLEFKKAIPIPVRKDWTFKIRCLGNLKASGVCYPSALISAVDRNGLHSFVHEVLGHQVDRILAPNDAEFLSDTSVFRVIRNLYAELVEAKINALPDNHEAKIAWDNTKIKYSKMYYLTPTEIFARCMEVYISLKVDRTSLAKSREELENSNYHSYDKRLLELIVPFFDEVLANFKDDQPLEYNLLVSRAKEGDKAKNSSITSTKKEEEKQQKKAVKVAKPAAHPNVKLADIKIVASPVKRSRKTSAKHSQLSFEFF